MTLKTKYFGFVLSVLLLVFGHLEIFGQATRLRFLSSEDNTDSIACKIIITDKEGHLDVHKTYSYSHVVDLHGCKRIECIPGETNIFFEANAECLETDGVIYFKIRSIDNYRLYKQTILNIKKANSASRPISNLNNGLGQSTDAPTRALTFK